MGRASGSIRGRLGLAALALTAGIGVTSLADGTAGAAASGAPITIVMITSLTGEGSSEFSNAPAGFNARIALQNAEGGIDGHKITGVVLDDQTSPTEIVTAVQDALSKNPVGIVSTSPLFFLADKYPQQAGMPVTGGFFDGPEWGTPGFTNMFASDVGSVDTKYPVNTAIGAFMKAHGGTVVCSYGYSISPSSSRSAIGTNLSFVHAGGKSGVLDTSIPFGSVAMTTPALAAKQAGCNAYYAGLDDNSNDALATALQQEGVKPKVMVFPTGLRRPGHRHPGLEGRAGWLLRDRVPALLPAERRHGADAEGAREVRPLLEHGVPVLQPVRVLARGRSHDQGPAAGRPDCIARRRHQGAARHHELQRQRAAP